MSLNDFIRRFTSRKFMAAVAAFVVAILSSAGVVHESNSAQITQYLTGGLLLGIQGIIDLAEMIKKPPVPSSVVTTTKTVSPTDPSVTTTTVTTKAI